MNSKTVIKYMEFIPEALDINSFVSKKAFVKTHWKFYGFSKNAISEGIRTSTKVKNCYWAYYDKEKQGPIITKEDGTMWLKNKLKGEE